MIFFTIIGLVLIFLLACACIGYGGMLIMVIHTLGIKTWSERVVSWGLVLFGMFLLVLIYKWAPFSVTIQGAM